MYDQYPAQHLHYKLLHTSSLAILDEGIMNAMGTCIDLS